MASSWTRRTPAGHQLRLPTRAPWVRLIPDLSLTLWAQLSFPLGEGVESGPSPQGAHLPITPLTLLCSLEAPGALALVPSPVCPLRRKLWQSKETQCMCVCM